MVIRDVGHIIPLFMFVIGNVKAYVDSFSGDIKSRFLIDIVFFPINRTFFLFGKNTFMNRYPCQKSRDLHGVKDFFDRVFLPYYRIVII